ncbi:TPA: hypothetical protein JDD69_004089 [Salmonella enterica]|nr:hypothetical protein [Salmonella enterica]
MRQLRFQRIDILRVLQGVEDVKAIAERLEQKGRKEGHQEGTAEKAQAIARQLRNMGMTPEQIEQAP